MQNKIRNLLNDHPLVPVVNFTDLSQVETVCENIIGRDIKCIEITLRGDVAVDAIIKVKSIYSGRLSVGAGTVVSHQQVNVLSKVGIDFLVSPGSTPALIQSMSDSGIPFIPGVMTPSEIIAGLNQGIDTFKLFPANIAGGLAALKAYASVFPIVKFCPTGGIGEDNYADYLNQANVISVGGSWLSNPTS